MQTRHIYAHVLQLRTGEFEVSKGGPQLVWVRKCCAHGHHVDIVRKISQWTSYPTQVASEHRNTSSTAVVLPCSLPPTPTAVLMNHHTCALECTSGQHPKSLAYNIRNPNRLHQLTAVRRATAVHYSSIALYFLAPATLIFFFFRPSS